MLIRTMLVAAVVATAAAAPAVAQQSKGKAPPACAAITFRPLNPGMPDGEHMAGMYSSRFGRMELMGTVQAGQPQDYKLLVKGQPLTALSGEVPKSVEPCLKSKNVALPYQKADKCVGPRFRVVVDNSGKEKLLMLFTIKDDRWALCQAGRLAAG